MISSSDTKIDKLYSLVQNLTKSEKRYFKLFCNKVSPEKDKNYLKLFDLVDGSKNFNDQSIIDQLNQMEVKTTYFDADKHYLYNLILKSLRVFHSGRTSKLQILEQIEYIEILYSKGLHQQALKHLRKAKKIATDYEILSFVPELLRLERKIKGHPVKEKNLIAEFSEYEEAIKKLNNFHEFDLLYRKGNWIRKNAGKIRREKQLENFDQILNNELFAVEGPHSFYASVRYYQTKAAYYYSKNELESEFKMNKT